MDTLVHPVYFGPIAYYVALAQANGIVFEKHDNYQKQTYRNRMYIATPEGPLLLNIPVLHSSKGKRGNREKVHQKYKDVRIENSFPWQKQHWKSLQIAYRTSPFFEFYEDDIRPLYEQPFTFLMDFCLQTFAVMQEALAIDIDTKTTASYEKEAKNIHDYRSLVEAKKGMNFQNEPYTQVLEKHHGFLPNLSVLDLLFNEGPNALHYLEQQQL